MAQSTTTGRATPTIGIAPVAQRTLQADEMAVAADRGNVLIGRGVEIRGSIERCASITVGGALESDGIRSVVLEIADRGRFAGVATATKAEIHGAFSGRLSAEEVVITRSAQVDAEIEYRELQIESGAKVSGRLTPK